MKNNVPPLVKYVMDSVVVFFGDKLEPIKVPAEPVVITSKMKIPYLLDSYEVCGK